jgi:nucleoid DNA-binding protein
VANVTKQDIIGEISKITGLTQADVKVAVEEFLSVVSDTLVGGKTIEIRGFGTFLTKVRKPRPARNPKTGEVVPLLERTVPLFKFSSDLRQKIDKGPDSGSAQKETPSQPKASDDSVIY